MTGTAPSSSTPDEISNWRNFAFMSGALALCFSLPLYQWARFAIGHELYSHLILIPGISVWLVWLQYDRLKALAGKQLSPAWIMASFSAGLGLLALRWLNPPAEQDALVMVIFAFLFFFTGTCFRFLNRTILARMAFPLSFLVLMVPFPVAVEAGLESILQHGSAPVAQAILEAIGTPVFREGTFFTLPGFKMQLAPECSGIHSTLSLFITSLVAGQLLLRSCWSRTVLTLMVVPIALLRNGLRVATIGELCVRIGPEMIESYIHRHGGPIFFVISLVPFSLLLLYLIKIDQRKDSLITKKI